VWEIMKWKSEGKRGEEGNENMAEPVLYL